MANSKRNLTNTCSGGLEAIFLLEGEIEAIVDGKVETIGRRKIWFSGICRDTPPDLPDYHSDSQ